MTPEQVAALIAYAVRLDPRLTLDDPAAADERLDQWCDLLSDVPATAEHPHGRHWHAGHVVRHHIATSPYRIQPSDISRPWHTFKADVLGRHTDPVPAADPDNAAAYRAELGLTRAAVAAGQQTATTYRQLTSGGPTPEAAARLAALGEYMPRTVAQQLATYRPRRARREQLAAADQPDPLDVPCTWCHAPIGEECRARSVRADGSHHSRRRATPHPSRVDDATARHNAQNGATS